MTIMLNILVIEKVAFFIREAIYKFFMLPKFCLKKETIFGNEIVTSYINDKFTLKILLTLNEILQRLILP